ncbi:hypothetical protein DRE_02208 [Drechslerella stenobrocha 248]|uniref:Uncharacterized protein n=1 Tax=Drechslerella stenobrocha 248 TaxID=1043628 RepID=W7HY55_9PEZI|nr:hypothetical protein DRE_02208 [Drechslerella stenobrocha 248]
MAQAKSDLKLLWIQALETHRIETKVNLEDRDNKALCEKIRAIWDKLKKEESPETTQEGQSQDEKSSNKVPDAYAEYSSLKNMLAAEVGFHKKKRNDGSNWDNCVHALGKLADGMMGVVSLVGESASAAFPPAVIIVAAATHIVKACNVVSGDLNAVEHLFGIMSLFAARMNLLEGRIPKEPLYQGIVMRTFVSMLKFCSYSHKRLGSKGFRVKEWAKALYRGEDPDLKDAYDKVVQSIDYLDSATGMATLGTVVDIQGEARDHHKAVMSEFTKLTTLFVTLTTSTQLMVDATQRQDRINSQQDSRILQNTNPTASSHLRDASIGPGAHRAQALVSLTGSLSSGAEKHMVQRWSRIGRAHIPGTLEWPFKQPSFTTWKENGGFLFVDGAAGTGKSTFSYKLLSILASEINPKSRESVACFSFDRDVQELQSIKNMLTCCSLQIACMDQSYLDRIKSLVQNKSISRNEGCSENKLWEQLFISMFKDPDPDPHPQTLQKRKATIILDGIDQLGDNDLKWLVSALRGVADDGTRLSFALTVTKANVAKANNDDDDDDITKLRSGLSTIQTIRLWENNVEDHVRDIERITKARLEEFQNLRRLQHNHKQLITSYMKNKADSFIYIEHSLRHYEHLRNTALISAALGSKLQSSTDEIYNDILKGCERQFTDVDQEILGYLLVWLAHTKQRLSLTAAQMLLHITTESAYIKFNKSVEPKPVSKIDIGLEIPGRLARQDLHFSASFSFSLFFSPPQGAAPDLGHGPERTFETASPTPMPKEHASIGFQEPNLRDFFGTCRASLVASSLCPSTSDASIMMLEMATAVLLRIPDPPNSLNDVASKELVSLIAPCWAEYLVKASGSLRLKNQRLDGTDLEPQATEHTDDERRTKLKGLYKGLYDLLGGDTNMGGFKKLESTLNAYSPITCFSILGQDGSHGDMARLALDSLAGIPGLQLQGSAKLTELIARKHIRSWFGATHPSSAYVSFRCAFKILDKSSAENSSERFTDDAFEAVAKHSYQQLGERFNWDNQKFGDMMGARQFSRISMALFFDCRFNAALGQAQATKSFDRFKNDKGAQGEDAGLNSVDIFDLSFRAARAKFEIWTEDNQELHKKFRVLEPGRDDAVIRGLGDVLELLNEAISKIPDNATDKRNLGEIICMTFQMKARIEILTPGGHNKVVDSMKKARTPYNGTSHGATRFLNALIEGLIAFEGGEQIPSLLEVLGNPLSSLCSEQTHRAIQRAAANSGKGGGVKRIYEMAIENPDPDGAKKTEIYCWLAEFNMFVLKDFKAAKSCLSSVLCGDEHDPSWCLTAGSKMIDILTNEFRAPGTPDDKKAVFMELEEVLLIIETKLGLDFNATQTGMNIPRCIMLQKLGPADLYFSNLKATLSSCLDALEDDNPGNDSKNLRVLAKLLSFIPGRSRDAKIALSCQFDRVTCLDNENKTEKFTLTCKHCLRKFSRFDMGSKFYLCRHCIETDLCKGCFLKRSKYYGPDSQDQGKGIKDYVEVCPSDHRHIRAPVEGWKGVEGGLLLIGDDRKPFKEWCKSLRVVCEGLLQNYWSQDTGERQELKNEAIEGGDSEGGDSEDEDTEDEDTEDEISTWDFEYDEHEPPQSRQRPRKKVSLSRSSDSGTTETTTWYLKLR